MGMQHAKGVISLQLIPNFHNTFVGMKRNCGDRSVRSVGVLVICIVIAPKILRVLRPEGPE